jgi:hypothetical protein
MKMWRFMVFIARGPRLPESRQCRGRCARNNRAQGQETNIGKAAGHVPGMVTHPEDIVDKNNSRISSALARSRQIRGNPGSLASETHLLGYQEFRTFGLTCYCNENSSCRRQHPHPVPFWSCLIEIKNSGMRCPQVHRRDAPLDPRACGPCGQRLPLGWLGF